MSYKIFFSTLCFFITLIFIAVIYLQFGNIFISGGIGEKVIVTNIVTSSDMDGDEIDDITDMLAGARAEIKNKTHYHSAYYSGGYPPVGEGVCSDVIWRALSEMGYNLKELIDEDIQSNVGAYPRVEGRPDSNIDFRRVPNLQVFFQRTHTSLTLEVIPGDIKNLFEWQAGDIVIFGKPKDHIAIVSDKRNKLGVPYMIHNSAPTPREDDWLVYWHENISPIVGHYRIIEN